jgi:hypothetical protein
MYPYGMSEEKGGGEYDKIVNTISDYVFWKED